MFYHTKTYLADRLAILAVRLCPDDHLRLMFARASSGHHAPLSKESNERTKKVKAKRKRQRERYRQMEREYKLLTRFDQSDMSG